MFEKPYIYVKLAITGLLAWWGDVPILVQALVYMMALDIIMGMLVGYAEQRLSSDISRKGITRKAAILLLVMASAIIQPYTGMVPLAQIVAGFFLAHEGLSLIENATLLGLPIPEQLKVALNLLQKRKFDNLSDPTKDTNV